jgi:hypothetical protein
MLVLARSETTGHRTAAHLLGRDLAPLCGELLRRPELWDIALMRPGAVWVCRRCWSRRFWRERVW